MPHPDERYCYHEDEDTGYRMEKQESGIETAYSTDQLRRADRYVCTGPDCRNQLLTEFGQPYNFDGITDAIQLLHGDQ